MMRFLVEQDLTSGAWHRTRAFLVMRLWEARANLEESITEETTLLLRERIRFIKEILGDDPKKEDYSLRKVQNSEHPLSPAFLFEKPDPHEHDRDLY